MQNVFSHIITIEGLASAEKKHLLKASQTEMIFIKALLKVEGVKSFEATIFTKMSRKEHRLDVYGHAKAKLELKSVVSLENFTKTYEADFSRLYDTKMTVKELKELEHTADIEEDLPDIIVNGELDLAAIALEEIALLIDDYPRKEGESFSFKAEFDPNESCKKNPFEVLAKLKK